MDLPPSLPVEQINEDQAALELAQLATAISAHDVHYWEEDAPRISDAEYNALKQRNTEIESRFPHLIREDSPSLRADLEDPYWSAKVGLDVPAGNAGKSTEKPIRIVDNLKPVASEIAAPLIEMVTRQIPSAESTSRKHSTLEAAEIALIKAMLQRGMRNAEVQFYFNRPDRRVNSGRITEIKSGARGAEVPAASDRELDEFVSRFTATTSVPIAPAPVVSTAPLPVTEEERVAALFAQDNSGNWRLKGGETDEIECKREVNTRKLAPIIRAMAGMANNRGGFILLGVEDKSCRVVGLPNDDFERLDPVKVTSSAQAHLQPIPIFTKGVINLGGHTVGYLKVAKCTERPVIVFSPGDRMENGAILFRYPAETACIRFGELRSLLDERDARRFRELAAATQRIAEIGVARAAILNTNDGSLEMEGRTQLVLDSALLDQINFIHEGHFNEVDGAPTLKVVGEVSAVESGRHGTARRLITDEDVLRNFLDQETVLEPVEYIRFAVAGSDRAWPPMFYFALQAGLASTELAGLIEATETTKESQRRDAAARAKGVRSARARLKGPPARRLTSLLKGDLTPPTDHKSAERLALAIQGLPNSEAAPLTELLALLRQCWTLILEAQRSSALSNVFRAAARLDEVFFRPS